MDIENNFEIDKESVIDNIGKGFNELSKLPLIVKTFLNFKF